MGRVLTHVTPTQSNEKVTPLYGLFIATCVFWARKKVKAPSEPTVEALGLVCRDFQALSPAVGLRGRPKVERSLICEASSDLGLFEGGLKLAHTPKTLFIEIIAALPFFRGKAAM